jgi:mono/diheme cytochrome c family protein
LKSGETKTGMDFRAEDDHVRLRDAGTGAEIIVAKREVADSVPSATSPMPAAFETVLSEQEFADLVDYLRNPGK